MIKSISLISSFMHFSLANALCNFLNNFEYKSVLCPPGLHYIMPPWTAL